jgi:hypothetical protein
VAVELFASDRATTTVSSGGTTAPAGGTQETWTVASSAMFGAASTGVSQFHVADPAAPTEIVAVTNVSGTTWTVTRGAESTTPVTHAAGFTVYQVVTTAGLGAFAQAGNGDLGGTGAAPTVTSTHLSAALPVNQGGTGSTTRNFAGLLTPVAVKTTTYSAAAGDFVPCDTTSGGFTVTLPNAPADLAVVGVKQVIQGGTNTVTVACAGSDVFNKTGGGTTATLTLLAQGMLLQYKAAGGIWYVYADDLALSQLDTRYMPVVYAVNYGAKPDSLVVGDAAMTATSATLTSATAGFTSASAGKTVNVTGAGAAGAMLTTTISAFVNSTTVTLAATASTTVSNARASIYGADQTANLQAAINATPVGGTCVLAVPNSYAAYLVTGSLKLYGATASSPVPVKLAGWADRGDVGAHLLASTAFPQKPVIDASTKYAPGGTATQFSFGEIENLYIDLADVPTATGAVGIYYDRIQQFLETKVKVRGGACGRVTGWANNLRFFQPECFNASDSYWKWLTSYSADAPWDTANAGNTVGPGQTYGDPIQFELIYPYNYLTAGALGITANAFYTIRAGNDFQIIGGHSLRTPGIAAYVLNGLNVDFSQFSPAKNLFMFTDMHEIDGSFDNAGNGAGVSLNNAVVAAFGDNYWASSAPVGEAGMWSLKLTNCADITVGQGKWNGLGVLLDGVNTQLNFVETRFTQSKGGFVYNSKAAGTLDSTMNALTLPQASIAVDNMTGTLPAAGSLMVATTASGPQSVTYTGQSTAGSVTTFTGCTGGSGTLATGGVVVLQSVTSSRFTQRYYAGALADNAETLAALAQASPGQARSPLLLLGNANTAALQISRAMDGKAWSMQMDTSATGTLQFKNPEGSTKLQLSDSGNLTPGNAIAITAGGTGQTTQQAAINALTGTQSSGKVLRSDGANATLAVIQAGDVPTLNQNTSGTAAGLSATLAVGSGGTGQVSAAAAYNALSPMTTTGDIEYESGASTASRLAGPTSATKNFLTSTGTGAAAQAPAWGTIAAGDLPAATTSTQGAIILTGTAGDIQPIGTSAVAGSSTKCAPANHVHSWGQAAPAGFTPANPTATASTTLVMMGLGSTCAYTPTGSGLVLVNVTGYGFINTTLTFMTVGARYGTGTAPVNGAAVSGTRFGAVGDPQIRGNNTGTNNSTAFAFTALLTLTPSTAYWFDIAAATNNAADTAQIQNVSMSFVELP